MPFPPVSILNAALLKPRTPTVEDLLGDLPEVFADMDVQTFAEQYQDVHRDEANAVYQGIAGFIQICSCLAGQDNTEQEYIFLRMARSVLNNSLDCLNEKDDDLRTLETLPTNGMAH